MSSEITKEEAIQIVCKFYNIEKMSDGLIMFETEDENGNKVWRLAFSIPVSSQSHPSDYVGHIVYVNVITGHVKPLDLL